MAYELCGPQFDYYLKHKLFSDDELQVSVVATMLDRDWENLTMRQYQCDMTRLCDGYLKRRCSFAYLSAIAILFKNRSKICDYSDDDLDGYTYFEWLKKLELKVINVLEYLSEIVTKYPKLSYLNVTCDEFDQMRKYLDIFFDDANNGKFHEFWKTLAVEPPQLNGPIKEKLMAELLENAKQLTLEMKADIKEELKLEVIEELKLQMKEELKLSVKEEAKLDRKEELNLEQLKERSAEYRAKQKEQEIEEAYKLGSECLKCGCQKVARNIAQPE